MRVLMTTTGYPGHLVPLVPFARALAAAGHDVCVAGPSSRGATVTRQGLRFCGCADPPAEDVAGVLASAAQLTPAEGHARVIAQGFGRTSTRALLPDVLQLAAAWRPDVIVRESQELAGALAAERHGIPHARVGRGPSASASLTARRVRCPSSGGPSTQTRLCT
jgi:UDP:flavonoid glycosyltransferase YjiC (YdhE family)